MKKKLPKKRSSRGKFLTKLDSLFRKILLLERTACCEWCGLIKPLQVSHILPKGRYAKLRWTRENVCLFCLGCHIYTWHRDVGAANEFMEKRAGKFWRIELMTLDKQQGSIGLADLKELEVSLKLDLEHLEKLDGMLPSP